MDFIFNAAICILIAGAFIGMTYVPVWIVDRAQRATCPACQGEGTVLFLPDCRDLCPKHWKRWDRIQSLEQLMDWDTAHENRESGMDALMRKLGGRMSEEKVINTRGEVRMMGDRTGGEPTRDVPPVQPQQVSSNDTDIDPETIEVEYGDGYDDADVVRYRGESADDDGDDDIER